MSTKQIEFRLRCERAVIPENVPARRILEITVRAPALEQPLERPGLNLALVIDHSGSMQGHKLAYVKQAALHVLDRLTERDRVAVVMYDEEVSVLSGSVSVTSAVRNQLRGLIQAIEVGGTTNLSGGWLEGCRLIAGTAQEDQLVRALLLTDGLANRGITDLEELGEHARQLHQRGVSTSTFGVGEGFNEHLLEQMANQGGGNFYFIHTPERIPEIFAGELSGLSAVTARRVEVSLEIPTQVAVQVLGGWKHSIKDGLVSLSLGDLSSQQTREVYITLYTPPANGRGELVFRAFVRALGANEQSLEADDSLTLRYGSPAEVEHTPVMRELAEKFATVIVAESANEALKLQRAGKRAEAAVLMEKTLLEEGAYLSAADRQYYENLILRLRQVMSEMDLKMSHYDFYTRRQRRTSS